MPTRLEDEEAGRIGRVSSRSPRPGRASLCRRAGAPGAVAAAWFFGAGEVKDVPLERLKFLAVHDTEPFARWEAGQQVATKILLDRIAAHQRGEILVPLDPDLIAAMRSTSWATPTATRPLPPRR